MRCSRGKTFPCATQHVRNRNLKIYDERGGVLEHEVEPSHKMSINNLSLSLQNKIKMDGEK